MTLNHDSTPQRSSTDHDGQEPLTEVAWSDGPFTPRPLDCDTLESRVLFSVSPFSPDLLDSVEPVEPDLQDNLFSFVEGDDQSATVDDNSFHGSTQDLDPNDASLDEVLLQWNDGDNRLDVSEIVFIDASVENFEILIDGLRSRSDADHIRINILDSDRDGIEQISDVLSQHNDVAAVHIVSHEVDGAVRLGSSWLSNESLDAYTGKIANWNSALQDGADLLFYGCDLAANEAGRP